MLSQQNPKKMQTVKIPPVKAMFEKGIPSLTTLDAYIMDLDQQLENKNKQ